MKRPTRKKEEKLQCIFYVHNCSATIYKSILLCYIPNCVNNVNENSPLRNSYFIFVVVVREHFTYQDVEGR